MGILRGISGWMSLYVVVRAALHLVGQGGPSPGETSAPRLGIDDFKKMHAIGAVLVVDVRAEESYRDGHIPGAIHVAPDDVKRRAEEIRSQARDRVVVTYCSCPSERTSATAALTLIKRGVKCATALAGGYPEWVASGGAVER